MPKRKKTKAQRRAIANKNLAKARRRRWAGHKKHQHRKLTKAQRRKVAMINLGMAWTSGRSGRPKKHGHRRSK